MSVGTEAHTEAQTDSTEARAATASGRVLLVLIIVPGLASLLLMVCSWAVVRTRGTVFVMLAILLALFAVQLVASLRLPQRAGKAVGIAFSVALVFFAVFGVAYAEYADFAGQESIFQTDRVGETFFVATTLGTATGFAPDVSSTMGLLVIAHLQLVILALGVAMTAASGLGRRAVQRARRARYLSETSAGAYANAGSATDARVKEGGPPPDPG